MIYGSYGHLFTVSGMEAEVVHMTVYNTRTENSKDNWSTPWYFYELLCEKWDFTLDPCASDENHKCDKYYTIEDNGYLQSWKGEVVFCNPPYSNNKEWIEKCYEEGQKLNTGMTIV